MAAVLCASASAGAVNPRAPHHRRVVADTLTAMPGAGLTKPLRTHPRLKFAQRATPAWRRFVTRAGGTWRAAWDPATGVPNRIWGEGIPAPGANASPAIAERFARELLAAHLDLLAPGAKLSDLVLVSNHSDGDQRSIGFVQYAGGLRVVGGQVSFRFKADRLFVIGSEALPNVVVPATLRLARGALADRARDGLRHELALPDARVEARGDEVLLPLVGDHAVLAYRVASRFEIDGGADGRYLAYVDPATGLVLAVEQQNLYATGTVTYRTADRHPARGYVDRPAVRAHVVVGGAAQTTGPAGGISWSPDTEQLVDTAVVGDLVTIVNKSTTGMLATAQLPIAPGGTLVWDASADQEQDAQLTTYVAANRVKDYVREHIDPNLPKLDDPIIANVNIDDQCNAFFDGESINFFFSSQQCQNTGLLEDVVYHEFGHNLHALSVIEGVGRFDGAMSEGASDFLAALITKDSGMGRGFFYTDEPLRELNPPEDEARWPRDIGEIHKTGIIFGGTFWDLWQALIAEQGEVAGTAVVNKLFVATLRRAVSIPSALIEALAADDDDGNLANGTPHECAIRDAFGRHGLRTATGAVLAPGALDSGAAATVIRADLAGLSERCSGDEIASLEMEWRPAFTAEPRAGSVEMEQVSGTRYWAQLPLAREGVVYFKVTIRFEDGSDLVLADNFADPFYRVYQGSTVPLYCTDFESGNPFEEGWASGTADGSETPWRWGEAVAGPTDPPAAFSGTKIVSQTPGGEYTPSQVSFLQMPPIDVGQYSDVRLQFRRWLAVEDSEFDAARVLVNGKQAWINFTADQGQRSSTHHIDKEWRFEDIGVSGFGFGHTLEIAWSLTTDEGLELGGWAIDDVCVVANRNSICGDGVKSLFEQCDDGADNADVPGACRTYCRLPACGDGILDEAEACDDGEGGSESCTPACQLPVPIEGGCCAAGGGGPVSLLLGALVGLVLRRRRRAA